MNQENKSNIALWTTIITGLFGLCAVVVTVVGPKVVDVYFASSPTPTTQINLDTMVALTLTAYAPITIPIGNPQLPTNTPEVAQPGITEASSPVPPTTAPQSPPTIPPTVPTVERISIKGKILNIDLPNFATNPVRGSITFNNNSEIASTRRLMVYLSVRDQSGTQWKNSDPQLLLTLQPGEQFCDIYPAEYNTANFYLGFQSHCGVSDACSYNVEGNRLWVTIGNVEVVIAPQGVACPTR